MNTRTRKVQRGFTLTEALVAFGITATGLLAVASFQGDLIADSAYNKARTEALSLAEQKIEQFKHYTLANEDSYIDDDGDGVMDPDGDHDDPDIVGQNAVFTRSWVLSTGADGRQVDVSVGWTDAEGVAQTVSLAAAIPWIAPRSSADLIAIPEPAYLKSPTGRAERGEGLLTDDVLYPDVSETPVYTDPDTGLRTFQNVENLLLVDANDRVLLTLLDVCESNGACTDFVKISGRVYLDTANTGNLALADLYVLSSDAAHCQRYVTSGSLANPPTTTPGSNYKYYDYTCYLGGGWHGNIGFVTASGIALNDKVCQGDPTVYDPFAISPDRDSPVIALRRTYRGLVQRVVDGNTIYETQGIADAAVIEGQDFVFTRLQPALTAGSNCVGTNRPMTRSDSGAGTLFAGVPGDFVCLNDDNLNADGDPVSDGQPDYLDSYQSPWTANVGCQFDPTDPPVLSHQISGTIAITGGPLLNLSGLQVITSDGVDNCVLGSFTGTLIDPLDPLAGANYTASYSCNVFDWGTGWSGLVHLEPNSTQLFCDNSTVAFSNVTANQTLHFSCESSATTLIQGTLQYTTNTDPIGGITIEDAGGIETGFCVILSGAYRCLLPYTGATVTAHIDVDSDDVVCGSVTGMNGLIEVAGASAASSPVRRDILIAQRTNQCP